MSCERNCGFLTSHSVRVRETRSLARLWPAWTRSPSRTNETYRTDLFTHRELILPSIAARLACVRACVDFLSQSRPSVRLSVRFVRPGALIHQPCYRLLSIYHPSATPSPISLLKPLSYSLSLNIIPFSCILSLLLYSNNSPYSSFFLLPKFSLIFFSFCFPKISPLLCMQGVEI